MGSHKNLIIEYIEMFFPGCSQAFFEELQLMIMDYESPQAEAFLEWSEFDYRPMIKDGKRLTTEEQYATELKSKTNAQIEFSMKDAAEALQAMPESVNAAYYISEVRLCHNELKSRK